MTCKRTANVTYTPTCIGLRTRRITLNSGRWQGSSLQQSMIQSVTNLGTSASSDNFGRNGLPSEAIFFTRSTVSAVHRVSHRLISWHTKETNRHRFRYKDFIITKMTKDYVTENVSQRDDSSGKTIFLQSQQYSTGLQAKERIILDKLHHRKIELSASLSSYLTWPNLNFTAVASIFIPLTFYICTTFVRFTFSCLAQLEGTEEFNRWRFY